MGGPLRNQGFDFNNNDEQYIQHEQYENDNIVLNDPPLDQALVTQAPTPEPRLLATLELPLAGRSFSTDSLSSLKDGRPALVCKMDGQPLSVRFLPYQHL